ncbi:MAG: 23S rRNA (adenine(2503)-C(2))-methyltransferase RlmN [Firmicutes bacterium]|nr:23S rRNA (adenine(2503)-C(2))-methyltransferase RlmN [Bacillota bacterium]
MKPDVQNMDLSQLETFVTGLGEKKFRAAQIFTWLSRNAASFEEMTDLPKGFREKLAEEACLTLPTILRKQESADGTRKYLLGFPDGQAVESVFMKYHHGNSICLSSQAGCKMGCVFCASTLNGFKRNLTAGEMLGEMAAISRDTGESISHIVIMGTGEPFDNYEEISRFLNLVHHPKGRNLSLRNITISTCGLIPGIEKFGKDFPQVNLAISLHAPNDELRSQLMPVNKKYPLKDLLAACRKHGDITGRRVTFEYTLIKDFNSDRVHAEELVSRLRGSLCHVNLIPLNPVKESPWKGVDRKKAQEFRDFLEDHGVPATVRRELGRDIDAACGQLRLGWMEDTSETIS